MALIVFTVFDTPEGTIDLHAMAEPQIPEGEDAVLTQAQMVGLLMLSAANLAAESLNANEAEEEETPKLVIVGGGDASS